MKQKIKRLVVDDIRRIKGQEIVLKKKIFKSLLVDYKLSLQERQIIYIKYHNFNYKYTISKLKNNCFISGHSRGIYGCVRLSRHFFKKMVLDGDIASCI